MKKNKVFGKFRISNGPNGKILVSTIKNIPKKTKIVQKDNAEEYERYRELLMNKARGITSYSAEENISERFVETTNSDFIALCEATMERDNENCRCHIKGFSGDEVAKVRKTIETTLKFLKEQKEEIAKDKNLDEKERRVNTTIVNEAISKTQVTIWNLERMLHYIEEDTSRYEIILYGNSGETETQKFLHKLGGDKGWSIQTNVVIPIRQIKKKNINKNTPTYEYDFIIVQESGVYNLEVKNYKGDIVVNRDGTFSRWGTKLERNPVEQCQKHCRKLKEIIVAGEICDSETAQDIVKGAIVVPNGVIIKNESGFPVFGGLDEKLGDFLNDEKILGSSEQKAIKKVISKNKVSNAKNIKIPYHGINKEYLDKKFYPGIKRMEDYNEIYRKTRKLKNKSR